MTLLGVLVVLILVVAFVPMSERIRAAVTALIVVVVILLVLSLLGIDLIGELRR